MIKTDKYARKPFLIDAVKVTSENIEEVAEWAMGEVRLTDKGDPYIHVRVHRPLTARQTKAFVGDWVLYANKGFKVYTEKAFHNTFDPVFQGEDSDNVAPKLSAVPTPPKPIEKLIEGTKDNPEVEFDEATPADEFRGDRS